jgi:hypothetical protein
MWRKARRPTTVVAAGRRGGQAALGRNRALGRGSIPGQSTTGDASTRWSISGPPAASEGMSRSRLAGTWPGEKPRPI